MKSVRMIEPVFLEGSAGRLFALKFRPRAVPKGHIVYIPPFGEEMNRCRSMVATQAANFAEDGYSCLLLDLFGTGDSQGELKDANWNQWKSDVETAVEWLMDSEPAPLIFWGIRLGGLLALDVASSTNLNPSKILLWQPVTNGKSYLTQVLRQRLAYLAGNDLPPETTQELRDKFASGESVEVAGYIIGGNLGVDIDAMHASSLQSLGSAEIVWVEQSMNSEKPLPPASVKMISHFQGLGNEVVVLKHSSPPIWQLHKRDHAPQLMDITREHFHS